LLNQTNKFSFAAIAKNNYYKIRICSLTVIYNPTSGINQFDKNALRKLRKQNVGKKSKF